MLILYIVLTLEVFLSTLSVRRATCGAFCLYCEFVISIHALREESDQHNAFIAFTIVYFYPRSP